MVGGGGGGGGEGGGGQTTPRNGDTVQKAAAIQRHCTRPLREPELEVEVVPLLGTNIKFSPAEVIGDLHGEYEPESSSDVQTEFPPPLDLRPESATTQTGRGLYTPACTRRRGAGCHFTRKALSCLIELQRERQQATQHPVAPRVVQSSSSLHGVRLSAKDP